MQKEEIYTKLFGEFNNLTIMVIGDVMVDSYLWGNVDRISPEAPIPIVALKKRENRMGGAANVALNLKALGARPVLCSVIGDDEKGNAFIDLMNREDISTSGVIRSKGRVTTTKFRIFGNNTQMLRVDEEIDNDLDDKDRNSLSQMILSIIDHERIDCIVFQDYNKGVLCSDLISDVILKARSMKIPMTVDPKKKNFEAFTGVTLFKPNIKELKEGLKLDIDVKDPQQLDEAARVLRKKQECEYVLVTLSEHGILISLEENGEDKTLRIPAHLRSIADVSGAGDTVISVASLCLALNCGPYEIAYISNLAGGLVCEEVGVIPVNKEKLLREVLSLI